VHEHGEVDMVLATLTVTRDRSEQVDFSESYFAASQALLVPQMSETHTPLDLAGRTIAVVRHSTSQKIFGRLLPQSKMLLASSFIEAKRALDDGLAAALLSDDVILHGFVEQNAGSYRLLDTPAASEHYAAAVAKGHPGLLETINRAVRRFIDTGEWIASVEQHMPGRPAELPTPVNMAETLADISGQLPKPDAATSTGHTNVPRHIQQRGAIVVGVKEDVPGLGYRDPRTGELSGLEIDLARAIAQEIFGDASKVVFRPVQTGERLSLVRSLARRFDTFFKLYSIMSTALCSNWWHLGMAGKLPTFLCPPECVDQQDFVGFDYYWGIPTTGLHRIQQLLSAMIGHYDKAPVWPGALYGMLKYYAKMFPHKELVLIENGSVENASGIGRATYIERHVREVERARRQGINISKYICWSITSNREWGLPFGPGNDFGLYHIDLDNDPELRRMPTPSAEMYRSIIKRHGEG